MTTNSTTPYDLQVMLTVGPADEARSGIGWSFALSAATAGSRVLVFLVGDGSAWAARRSAEDLATASDSALTYLESFIESGGEIECCSTCLNDLEEKQGRDAVRDGIRSGGMTSAAIRATEVSTVTF